MKRLFCLIFILALTFASCSKKVEYKNDLACEPLAKDLSALCPVDDGYSEYGEDQIRFFFENTSIHDDYAIFYSTNAEDINEIGIFHCPNEDSAEEMARITENYIKMMQDTQINFISSYAPYEIPKLESAEVRRYGNYVVYTILDTDERRSVYSLLEKDLIK